MDSGKEIDGVFELHYIELKKFTKTSHEIQSALDRWSSFLTTTHQLDREHTPKELASDKNIVKAIAAIDRMFNEEERQVYEVRLKEFTDVASIIASGDAKNVAKGREEGKEETTRTIALRLIEQGVEIAIIKSVTGLSVTAIEELAKR